MFHVEWLASIAPDTANNKKLSPFLLLNHKSNIKVPPPPWEGGGLINRRDYQGKGGQEIA